MHGIAYPAHHPNTAIPIPCAAEVVDFTKSHKTNAWTDYGPPSLQSFRVLLKYSCVCCITSASLSLSNVYQFVCTTVCDPAEGSCRRRGVRVVVDLLDT